MWGHSTGDTCWWAQNKQSLTLTDPSGGSVCCSWLRPRVGSGGQPQTKAVLIHSGCFQTHPEMASTKGLP